MPTCSNSRPHKEGYPPSLIQHLCGQPATAPVRRIAGGNTDFDTVLITGNKIRCTAALSIIDIWGTLATFLHCTMINQELLRNSKRKKKIKTNAARIQSTQKSCHNYTPRSQRLYNRLESFTSINVQTRLHLLDSIPSFVQGNIHLDTVLILEARGTVGLQLISRMLSFFQHGSDQPKTWDGTSGKR